MSRLPWRKAKTLAMLANKRQWLAEYGPEFTTPTEIYSGADAIITEQSTVSVPTYIQLEQE